MPPLTKTDLLKMFKILGIEYEDIANSLVLGTTEQSLLSNEDKLEIAGHYCLIGTDGTTGAVAEDDPDAPTLVAASSIVWGVVANETCVQEATNRIVLQGQDRESNSGFRTMLELQQGVCLAIAMERGSFDCSGCPFADYGCTWKRKKLEPWTWFPGKTPVVICDLPVEFKFVTKLPKESPTRKFFETHLKHVFKAMRDNHVRVILVTHRSKIQDVSKEFTSQIDDAIGSLDERAKALIDVIKAKGIKLDGKLKTLAEIFDWAKDKDFTDYDLLESWMDDIGKPSPVFKVLPSDLNNMWGELKFHYVTWGYRELLGLDRFYAQSCWVRIGYTPALDPVVAHKITLLEMALGKGHSIALTMAHNQCNMYKDKHLVLLKQHFNKDKTAKHRIGFSVKTTNKWRLSRS